MERCADVCVHHSGMEEKDTAADSKYNQIIWVIGICGTVLSLLATILIYQNNSIRDTLGEMKISIATVNIQFAASTKTGGAMRKDIDDLRREVEALKSTIRK